ncbi:bifunctional folylpolyglutamate synthase/dihydrofolate synthase [Anaerosphaera multitolerans]|uniref:tetrahydrofolate synthase n=1 Tax=Anaerosphaera multitolerans TaxID=2487351 RepID=A0A437S5T5_9FIRM|nr:folylpolyglutamate synthase/dihydrofolate synthase family protein [Anaerosphaera multitolerans]RVU54381.1 bifunctional folylpolyglutamate synthase/dihydrofolate synthase [Anaerosphaera multitolerans]
MEYEKLVSWMLDRGDPQGGYTLDNVRKLLLKFDNPQDKIKTIHVAGTNGKGSVCSYIQNSLSNSNLKCGLFISPYIEDIRETIQIDGNFISDNSFNHYLKRVYDVVNILDKEGYYTTTFEIFATVAFLYFYEEKVDVAVIEVGLGGRTDATNVISKPMVSIITSISKDHVGILGSTLKEIAYEKGGIIKKGVDVFIYPGENEATNELKEIAEEKNAPLHSFNLEEVEIIDVNNLYNEFSFRDFKNYKTSILGRHQVYNASLSLMVLNYLKTYFNLKDEIIKSSIYSARNIARLEVLKENPLLILDGSHNVESIKALVENLSSFKYKNLILGFSVLGDKDFDHILENLIPKSSKIVLTEVDNPRAIDLKKLYRIVSKFTDKEVFAIADRRSAFLKTVELANEEDLILWCGSLYLVRDIRKIAIEELKQ